MIYEQIHKRDCKTGGKNHTGKEGRAVKRGVSEFAAGKRGNCAFIFADCFCVGKRGGGGDAGFRNSEQQREREAFADQQCGDGQKAGGPDF